MLPRQPLPFEILTNDKLEAARTGNWFLENNLIIARLPREITCWDHRAAELRLQEEERV